MAKTGKYELPATLDWYRQGANWLVALSTGAVAVGLSLADRIQAEGSLITTAFLLAGLGYLVTIVTGVLSYFWLNSLGNSLENKAKLEKDLKTGTNQQTSDALAIEKKKVAHAQNVHGNLYLICLSAFIAAAVLSAVDVALIARTPAKVADKQWQVVGTDAESIAAVMVEQTSGESWALVRDPRGGYLWRPLTKDTTSR